MKENKKLGKGFSDLLKSNLPDQIDFIQKDANRVKSYVPIKDIVPNPYQPRLDFDEEKLQELAASIKERGILTPILLRSVGNKYEIVAGERRFRAAKMCNMQIIPAIVEHFNDNDMAEIALIENVQREDLNAMEEAQAYADIMNNNNLTQAELAKKIGKTRPYIANTIRLLTLPDEVKKMVANNELSMGHARALIGLPDETLNAIVKEITNKKLNVRETEAKVNALKRNQEIPYRQEAEDLAAYLKADVKIDRKQIRINYKDKNELDEIIKKIIK